MPFSDAFAGPFCVATSNSEPIRKQTTDNLFEEGFYREEQVDRLPLQSFADDPRERFVVVLAVKHNG